MKTRNTTDPGFLTPEQIDRATCWEWPLKRIKALSGRKKKIRLVDIQKAFEIPEEDLGVEEWVILVDIFFWENPHADSRWRKFSDGSDYADPEDIELFLNWNGEA